MLSIWVECDFESLPVDLQTLAGVTGPITTYSFRLTRGGGITRKLGSKTLSQQEFETLLEHFVPIYVPPIRDLNADGLVPFKHLIKTALQRARGAGNISKVSDVARKLLEKKATGLLDEQGDVVLKLLQADKLSLDTSRLDIEAIYENLGLCVHSNGVEMPLGSRGTGHQSAVIMHLYRQLGENMDTEVLYLFEEPDNHLHPSTIRSICDDLRRISEKSQVLVSTHSPILLAHVGVSPLRPLGQTPAGTTVLRYITLLNDFTEKQARAILETYGVRLTEPLLSSRVVVFEGSTDKVIFATLFEKRKQLTVDQAGVLLIAAGGKDKVVSLCHLLKCLDVEWCCVMDSDAAFSSEVPYTRLGATPEEINKGIAAIDIIKALLDTSKKRGKNADNSLGAIRNELATTRPVPQYFDNSPLKVLVEKTKTLTLAEQAQLKTALAAGRKRNARTLLAKARAFIWSGTIEEVLAHDSESEHCIESALVQVGELTAPLPADSRRSMTLRNKLHAAGNKPEVLSHVVTDLDDGGHLNRGELNQCYKLLFPDPE